MLAKSGYDGVTIHDVIEDEPPKRRANWLANSRDDGPPKRFPSVSRCIEDWNADAHALRDLRNNKEAGKT